MNLIQNEINSRRLMATVFDTVWWARCTLVRFFQNRYAHTAYNYFRTEFTVCEIAISKRNDYFTVYLEIILSNVMSFSMWNKSRCIWYRITCTMCMHNRRAKRARFFFTIICLELKLFMKFDTTRSGETGLISNAIRERRR